MSTSVLYASVTRPTLIVDGERARRNIGTMVGKAAASGTRLRPHVKTHQSRIVADWFRAEGVTQVTVSSVAMAEQFLPGSSEPYHPRVEVAATEAESAPAASAPAG